MKSLIEIANDERDELTWWGYAGRDVVWRRGEETGGSSEHMVGLAGGFEVNVVGCAVGGFSGVGHRAKSCH